MACLAAAITASPRASLCPLSGAMRIAVTRFHVTPLVATLAVNALLLSFTNWYSGGFQTCAPDGINQFVLTKTGREQPDCRKS